MAAALESRVLDFGLDELDSNATHIRICSSEPTTYAQATTTYMLGFKSWAAGGVFGSPADDGSTRKVTSTAVTDGTITTTGTAQWWAITDETNSFFLAHGSLSASQAVTSGNTFTLGVFDIKIPKGA